MTTIIATGYKYGMIIAADSQSNKRQISTGRVIERSIGHKKIFPIADLPMVAVDAGMEMTGMSSLETRLNTIRKTIEDLD